MTQTLKDHERCPGTDSKIHDFHYDHNPAWKATTYVCLYCEQIRQLTYEDGKMKVEVIAPSQKA